MSDTTDTPQQDGAGMRELKDQLASIYADAANEVAPKQDGGSPERAVALGMMAQTLIPIIQLIQTREAALIEKIRREVPKKLEESNFIPFSDDKLLQPEYANERIWGFNYAVDDFHAALDRLEKERA